MADDLRALRDSAIRKAAAELERQGFTASQDGWVGTIEVGDHEKVPVVVKLSEKLPDALPEIRLATRASLGRRVPHVEDNGKICIAPSSGVLIDSSNVEGIIVQSLERARTTIQKGLSGANAGDFRREFLAYWDPVADLLVFSICKQLAASRQITRAIIQGGVGFPDRWMLFVDDQQALEQFVTRIQAQLLKRQGAFLVSFQEAFEPPDFQEVLNARWLTGKLNQHAFLEAERGFREWLAAQVLPITVLVSFPLETSQGRVLIGVLIPRSAGEARRRALQGFRENRIPADYEMGFILDQPIKRLRVTRFDPAYLLTRGGAEPELQKKTVALIGCGAIGSHLAGHLVSLGMGEVRLVDNENFETENLHRHYLGLGSFGSKKAEALSCELEKRYATVKASYEAKDIESVLTENPEFVTKVDLLIFATGEETLELRMNQLLHGLVPRVHVWLEPLGMGGHVLAVGMRGKVPGCFRCLYEAEPLANAAALLEQNQNFQRSYAGCSGTFNPLTELDADRAALEAARIVVEILTNKLSESLLVSWCVDREPAEKAGLRLSKRGKSFTSGER
ncbi:MAG: hypothetical protein A3J74_08265, partial [Elusimicrobia bacterium RIFCSPHIGHO2_02_FULL_57_9]